jgi:hypothetical protein
MPQRVIGVAELWGLVGQEVGVSDWFTLTQERINAFAEVTEDRQWIHCDADRARAESPYGTTIAHGYLTLSLLSHLLSQAVRVRGPFSRIINYGLNRVRFPAAAGLTHYDRPGFLAGPVGGTRHPRRPSAGGSADSPSRPPASAATPPPAAAGPGSPPR